MTSNLDNLLSVAASSLYIKILNKLWVRLDQVQYYHYPPFPQPHLLNWKSKSTVPVSIKILNKNMCKTFFYFHSLTGSGSNWILMETWIRI